MPISIGHALRLRGTSNPIHCEFTTLTGRRYGFIDGNRLLLGDKFGKLTLLTLIRTGESKRVHKMSLHKFGEVNLAVCCSDSH
jgi:hypothetical protein